jgi:hypothetical protein
MKMISLKVPKQERKKETKIDTQGPAYPYDTRITIKDDVLKKMPDIYENVEVGDIVIVKAKAKVISVSENQQEPYGGGKKTESCRVELQLTDIACEKDSDGEMEDGFEKGSAD